MELTKRIVQLLESILTRMVQKRIVTFAFRAPITTPQVVDFTGNVAAIRNGGTSTVVLNNGSWSLRPGESLHFGSQTDYNNINMQKVAVTFDTATGNTNLLQILEAGAKLC